MRKNNNLIAVIFLLLTLISTGVRSEEAIENKQDIVTEVKVAKNNYFIGLEFPWELNVGACLYKRFGYYWLVFDRKKDFDFKISEWAKDLDVKTFNNELYTIIRMKVLAYDADARIVKNNNNWQVNFFKKGKLNLIPTEVVTEEHNILDDSIDFNFHSARQAIIVTDPHAGDKLLIIPFVQPDIGLPFERRFVDFKALDSAQGLAINIMNEDLEYRVSDEYIKIFAPNFKYDSKIAKKVAHLYEIAQFNRGILAESAEKDSLLYLPVSQYAKRNFNEVKRELTSSINFNDKVLINKGFYKLAIWYFQEGLYYEAASLLEQINDFKSLNVSSIKIKFLNAICNIYMDRYKQALKILDEIYELAPNSEVKIWINYCQYKLDHLNSERVDFVKFYNDFIYTYPEELQQRLALIDVKLSLAENNLARVEYLLLKMQTPKSSKFKNAYKYYQARFYQASNLHDNAVTIYNELAQDLSDLEYRAITLFELLKLRYFANEVTLEGMVDEADGIRLNWRSGKNEYEILSFLASASIREGDYIGALKIYSKIIDIFGSNVNNIFITSEMTQIFNKIFKPDGIAKDLSDYEAVALYFNFKELTPIGNAGDEIILNLSDRLMNLDLLNGAEALMHHQINYRLKGASRLKVADKLAYIYLNNNKPLKAIKIVEDTDEDNTNYHQHQKRLLIKAIANKDLGNFEEAFNLIRNNHSLPANKLRLDIFYKQKKWLDYIRVAEKNLPVDEIEFANLTVSQIIDIKKLILVYSFANQNEKIEQIIAKSKKYPEITKLAEFVINDKLDKDLAIEEFVDIDKLKKFKDIFQ